MDLNTFGTQGLVNMNKPPFNPKQPFEASKAMAQKPAFDPNKPFDAPIAPKSGMDLEAGLQGFGEGVGFGYLPQLQALGQKITEPIYEAVTGVDLPDESYVEARDIYAKRGRQLAQESPKSFGAGLLGGAVAMPGLGAGKALPVVGKMAGVGGKLARGAATGGLMGAIANPGDVEGELSPLQLEERGKNLLKGAATGAAISGVGAGLSKVGEKAKQASDAMTLKATGAIKSQFDKLLSKKQVKPLADFARKNKIVGIGSTPSSVLSKTDKILSKAGKEIGDTYKDIQSKIPKEGFNLENATPEQIKQILGKSSIDTKQISGNMITRAKDLFDRGEMDKDVFNAIKREATTLSKRETSLESLFDYRKQLDKKLQKIYKKPMADLSAKEDALVAMRREIKDRIDRHISTLDDITKSNASKKLKELNEIYNKTSALNEISKKGTAGLEGNNLFGLPEYIAGGAYGGYSVANDLSEGDVEGAAGSALKALTGMALMKAGRTYGPGVASGLLNKGGGLLQRAGGALERSPGLVERVKAGYRNE